MTNTYRFTHEMFSLLKLATRGRTGEMTNSTHNSLKKAEKKKTYAKTPSCPKNDDKMREQCIQNVILAPERGASAQVG